MSEVEVVSGEVVEFGSLLENEQIIESGMTSFVEVGRALMRIRDDRQYVMAGFDTFDDYCRARWDLDRSNAHRQISFAQVTDVLRMRNIEPPSSIRSATPLGPILNEHGEEAVTEAWLQIVGAHDGDGPITGAEVSRFLKLGGTGANYGKPGWREMLGAVGDTLIRADKQLAKLEAAATRRPNQDFRDRAGVYADQADDLAQRLRSIGEAA